MIEFMHCLTVPSGHGQGTPLRLRPWQVEFVFMIYAPVALRARRIRRALLSIARKNGKTALAAALVLVHLIGPEAKPNSEVYSAASDRNQASHIYKTAKQMIELDEDLSSRCGFIDTQKRIVAYHLGSFYSALSADARRQHGFNPCFVIYDELAQAHDRELFDVLNTSFGAQEEPLLLAISTQSNDPLSVMSELADDAIKQEQGLLDDPSFYGRVYAVPEKDKHGNDVDIYDEKHWSLANPALSDFRSLDDFRALAHKAKRSPSAEASFRNLFLNQRVDAATAFVNSVDWKACGGDVTDEETAGLTWYGGLDLSAKKDLTAFSAVCPLPDGRIASRHLFWLPRAGLDERERKDGAQYRAWSASGHLTLIDRPYVDFEFVAAEIDLFASRHNLVGVAYDRYRITEFQKAMDVLGVPPERLNLHPYGQGFRDMGPAIDSLEEKIIGHTLLTAKHPVLTYCISNVKTSSDPAGNRKFDKRTPNRRIDGAVSLAMAIAMISRGVSVERDAPSVYEQRGLRVL